MLTGDLYMYELVTSIYVLLSTHLTHLGLILLFIYLLIFRLFAIMDTN